MKQADMEVLERMKRATSIIDEYNLLELEPKAGGWPVMGFKEWTVEKMAATAFYERYGIQLGNKLDIMVNGRGPDWREPILKSENGAEIENEIGLDYALKNRFIATNFSRDEIGGYDMKMESYHPHDNMDEFEIDPATKPGEDAPVLYYLLRSPDSISRGLLDDGDTSIYKELIEEIETYKPFAVRCERDDDYWGSRYEELPIMTFYFAFPEAKTFLDALPAISEKYRQKAAVLIKNHKLEKLRARAASLEDDNTL